MKNLNNKYIKTIRMYIVEIGGDYTNLYTETFISKLNKDIVPSLLSLNKKLKKTEVVKMKGLFVILCLCFLSLFTENRAVEIITVLYITLYIILNRKNLKVFL